MKKIYFIGGGIIIVMAVVFIIVSGGASHSSTSSLATIDRTAETSSSPASTATTSRILFADSPFASSAYLLSTDTYDARTQQALSGFRVDKKTLADGSMQITLAAQRTEYQTQTYVVTLGEKLYFIERSFGDDAQNQDMNIHDDQALLVDASGYIVQ